MIQISEEKKEKLSEMCEKMLHYGGKMMQCLESLGEGEEEPEHSGMRGGYRKGMRGGYRDDDYYNEPEPMMGMRRGGRRSRYDGEW